MLRPKTKAALKKIAELKPCTFEDFGSVFELKALNRGTFREVYRIVGTMLVVKFPLSDDRPCNIRHSATEIRRMKRLVAKIPFMKEHMPRVYYYHAKSGIIVMEFIDGEEVDFNRTFAVSKLMRRLFRHAGVALEDASGDNIIVQKRPHGAKRAVIVDFGY